MKYLEEMSDKELVKLGKDEKIFLGLFFNRENIIKKLMKKGYLREAEKKEEKVSSVEIENNKIEVLEDKLIEVEEIDLSKVEMYRTRSKKYYRNFPNKKLFKRLKKRYRKKETINKFNFKIEGLSKRQIKSRETETEINKSKFDIGKESEYKRDIYFDRDILPSAYFVDEVVLMPKNHSTLYVYWEIREDTFEKLKKNNEILESIVIKILKNGTEYKRIMRDNRIGSYFITEIEYGQKYEAQIGYEDYKGNYKKVASSNEVIAPNNKVSNELFLTWGTVKWDENTNQVIKYITPPELFTENIDFINIMDKNYQKYNDRIIEKMKKIETS